MTTPPPQPFSFTGLVEPTANVSPSPPPEPFDAGIAYLLGQCCSLTYTQFDQGTISLADFSSLVLTGSLTGYMLTASNLTQFTASEANEPLVNTGDIGDYITVPAGFGVLLTLEQPQAQTLTFTVIALRGTQTFEEWLEDAEAFPVPFAGVVITDDGLGSVHGGFYAAYTVGTDGQKAVPGQELSSTLSQRAAGSLAAQVGAYVEQPPSATAYVTGHSLGGALATFCALDIAYSFPSAFSQLSMYSLASPRVAVGISDSVNFPIPTLGNQQGFLLEYQTHVPNSYQIVNAADIVPILPPLSTPVGPLTLICAQATDPYQVGSGATATATISKGEVNQVDVDNSGSSGYNGNFPPSVLFSGGEPTTPASATADVDVFGNVKVSLVNSGAGYTSAPTVQIVSSGSLTGNVVGFCAQTGDIGNNHSCVSTYVPYLQALASTFSS